jgi:vacuolar-type H+-ATPase subunit I/STV1
MTGFLKLFDILPGWVWAALVAGLSLTNCATHILLQSERLEHQTSKTEYAQRVADAERQRAEQEAQHRAIEQELSHAVENEREKAQALYAEVDSTRAAGRVASERLRNAARATAKLSGEVCANTAAASVRETAASAARVLADVFAESEQRAGILAATADQRSIAGRACEQAYDTARKAVSR